MINQKAMVAIFPVWARRIIEGLPENVITSSEFNLATKALGKPTELDELVKVTLYIDGVYELSERPMTQKAKRICRSFRLQGNLYRWRGDLDIGYGWETADENCRIIHLATIDEGHPPYLITF